MTIVQTKGATLQLQMFFILPVAELNYLIISPANRINKQLKQDIVKSGSLKSLTLPLVLIISGS